MLLLIKGSPENRKLVFNAIKAKILAHLDALEKKEAETVQKTYCEAVILLTKGGKGLPIGTVREWKGKKFIKVASGKWKPKYESETRGARMSVAALKKKIELCEDAYQMMQLVLENRDRFSGKDGNPLPFVQQLSDFIRRTQEKKKEPHLQAFETEYQKTKAWYADAKATVTEIESLEKEIRSLDRKIKSVKKQGMSDTNPTLAGWYGCHNAQKEILRELQAAKEAGFTTLQDYKNAKKPVGSGEDRNAGGEPTAGKNERSKESYTKILRKKLKNNLRGQFGFHKNKKTGIEANLSGSSVDKMSSDKAIEKSKKNGFTVDEHFEVASKIVSLYEDADLIKVTADKKGSPDIKSIKRFESAVTLKNGEGANAYITVKENIQNGHKIYSVEVMELEKNTRSRNRAGEWQDNQEIPLTSTISIPKSSKKSSHKADKNVHRREMVSPLPQP